MSAQFQSDPFRWPPIVCAIVEQASVRHWLALIGAVVLFLISR